MMRTGPPELMPVTRAVEIPNQELVREKPMPRMERREKLRFRGCGEPISVVGVSIWFGFGKETYHGR